MLGQDFFRAATATECEAILRDHRQDIEATFRAVPQVLAVYLVAHEDAEMGRFVGLAVEFAEDAVPQPDVNDPMNNVICTAAWGAERWLASFSRLGAVIANNLDDPECRGGTKQLFRTAPCLYRRT